MGRQHLLQNSRMGMSGKAGIAVDIAGSAAHVAGSTGHILAHTLDIELHSRMGDSSRGHTPAPLPRGYLRQSNR
jgi:hypothetical protein